MASCGERPPCDGGKKMLRCDTVGRMRDTKNNIRQVENSNKATLSSKVITIFSTSLRPPAGGIFRTRHCATVTESN